MNTWCRHFCPRTSRLLAYSEKIRRKLSVRGEYLFIASMPKSGSTFMAKALEELTGYRYAGLTYGYERDDQNLYLPKLIDAYTSGTVTHQHVRATGPNTELFSRFGIRPVVLTRNIFDVVISIRDHVLNEGPAFPSFFCDEGFANLDQTLQLDFIIELGVPWYYNFYVSWYEASRVGALEALWLTYDEVVKDWAASLKAVVDFYGLNYSEQQIAACIENTRKKRRSETRLNKGVPGRGQSALSEDQIAKIVAMSRFYPTVDFTPIGLGRGAG